MCAFGYPGLNPPRVQEIRGWCKDWNKERDIVKRYGYGRVSITFGAEDTGGWIEYASVNVADRRELEDLLRKLEGALKKAVDQDMENGGVGYGPLKSPREYLDELATKKREYEQAKELHRQQRRPGGEAQARRESAHLPTLWEGNRSLSSEQKYLLQTVCKQTYCIGLRIDRLETVHKNNGHFWIALIIAPPSHGLTLLSGCSTLVQAL
jgi:hypothetical protein